MNIQTKTHTPTPVPQPTPTFDLCLLGLTLEQAVVLRQIFGNITSPACEVREFTNSIWSSLCELDVPITTLDVSRKLPHHGILPNFSDYKYED